MIIEDSQPSSMSRTSHFDMLLGENCFTLVFKMLPANHSGPRNLNWLHLSRHDLILISLPTDNTNYRAGSQLTWRPRGIEFKFLGPECLADHILNTSVKQFSTALRKKCGPQFLHFIFWVSLADKVKLVLY